MPIARMIHIATVHALFGRWVDIQLRHLAKHIDSPYRVYASLDGDAATLSDRFFFADTRPSSPTHHARLNFLAEVIVEQADNEDILVFMDGDAFPIADLAKPSVTMLSQSPLAAIRRDENLEPHPHPAFCVTTVGFWKQIQGDWRGVRANAAEAKLPVEKLKRLGWKPATFGRGRWVMGPGGRLREILRERRIDWIPLLRTNIRNLHPVNFGVYGDLIYHHGEGFRGALTRADQIQLLGLASPSPSKRSEDDEKEPEARERNGQVEALVFERIKSDEQFHLELFQSAGTR